MFSGGSLKGKTVNVKFYGKQEGILDISTGNLAEYYLVLTGPKSPPVTSMGQTRPLTISYVYLFEMKRLVKDLKDRGVKIGIATSIAGSYWKKAQVYPKSTNC